MSDPAMPPTGSPLPPPPPVDYSGGGVVETDPQQKNMAMIGYLLNLTIWLGPLIIYLLKKDDPTTRPWLRQQLANSLNWGITMMIGILIGILTTPLFCIGAIFNIALFITNIVFVILNSMKANRGENAGVPFAIKFVK